MRKFNLRYAIGEVVLIFMGITLAIAFQNWNENQKERKLEENALRQLRTALQNDMEDVEANLQTHERGFRSCQEIFQILESEEAIDSRALIQRMGQAGDYTFLISDVSTYEYLKSVGLHIIQNAPLRKQITKLYDVIYEGVRGTERNVDPILTELSRETQQFYTGSQKGIIARADVNELKSAHGFRFHLKRLELSHRLMKQRYEQKVKPALQLLIQLLEQELKNK